MSALERERDATEGWGQIFRSCVDGSLCHDCPKQREGRECCLRKEYRKVAHMLQKSAAALANSEFALPSRKKSKKAARKKGGAA